MNVIKDRKKNAGRSSRYVLLIAVAAGIFLLHGTGMATDASSMKLPYKTALSTMYTELTGTAECVKSSYY